MPCRCILLRRLRLVVELGGVTPLGHSAPRGLEKRPTLMITRTLSYSFASRAWDKEHGGEEPCEHEMISSVCNNKER